MTPRSANIQERSRDVLTWSCQEMVFRHRNAHTERDMFINDCVLINTNIIFFVKLMDLVQNASPRSLSLSLCINRDPFNVTATAGENAALQRQ